MRRTRILKLRMIPLNNKDGLSHTLISLNLMGVVIL